MLFVFFLSSRVFVMQWYGKFSKNLLILWKCNIVLFLLYFMEECRLLRWIATRGKFEKLEIENGFFFSFGSCFVALHYRSIFSIHSSFCEQNADL